MAASRKGGFAGTSRGAEGWIRWGDERRERPPMKADKVVAVDERSEWKTDPA
jgi:hypothetical protein